MADERPIVDVIRGLEDCYDEFPVHIIQLVKEQRVEVTVGRKDRRIGLTFYRTEAPAPYVLSLVVAALEAAGYPYRGRLR